MGSISRAPPDAARWMSALLTLTEGPRRYSELQAAIGDISPKMLTQTLRGLERDGMVTRTVHPVVPPRVEPALSPIVTGLDPW